MDDDFAPHEISFDPDTRAFVENAHMLDRLDERLIDRIKDAAALNDDRAVERLLLEVVADDVREKLCQALRPVLSYIVESSRPKFAADIAAFCVGLKLRDGWTTSAHAAAAHGLTRTTARVEVQKFCEMVGIRIPDERDGSKNSTNNQRNQKLYEE